MTGMDIDPAWLFTIGGVILLIAEIVAPGFFLLFVGAAALATGVVALLFGLGLVPQLAIFAVLAYLSVHFGGRRFYAARYDYSSAPDLNNPTARLLGRVVTVGYQRPAFMSGRRVHVSENGL